MEKLDTNLDVYRKNTKAEIGPNGQKDKITLDLLKSFTLQILRGIHYVHSKGFMHRDMKPENLMMNMDSKQIKIGDFGLARMKPDQEEECLEVPKLQRFISTVGTEDYTAPEIDLLKDRMEGGAKTINDYT